MWNKILGFENYLVSSSGQIVNSKNMKMLSLHKCNKGYIRCSLYKNGVKHTKKVHRLVAESFIFNEFNKEQVNHIDGNKENNHYLNLEWNTNKENCNHSRQTLGHKNSSGKDNSLSMAICCKKDNIVIKKFESINEAKRQGYNIANISQCLNGKRKTHKGYVWEYLPQIIGIQQ